MRDLPKTRELSQIGPNLDVATNLCCQTGLARALIALFRYAYDT
jgi:hypothetical protein